ncbi:hypothetical protein [Brevundimonas sp.]|uniref:hypothetical protein n=1 Tax=Brevundimonas sp. TaxID=1871086 RepID=UPI0035B256EC
MRRPDLTNPLTATVSALTLAGTLCLAGQAMAQDAAAPRYMNWNGRGPAVMPQGVQTASNETTTPRRANTPIPHGGFARAAPPAAAQAAPARRTLTPASAWITPGASYGMASAVAPSRAAASAAVETREVVPTPAPTPTRIPVEAPVDLPPPPRAPTYSPNVAPQPQAQFQAQRQDDRQFLPEYLAGQGGAQPAPSQAVYADSPRPASTAAPTYAEPQPAPSEAADPMAPRRDAPIFRLQRPAPVAPAPIPGPSAEAAPSAPQGDAAPAPRQMAAVTANPSDHPEMQPSRRYSVHRQNGQQPDAVALPQPTYVDALAVTLTDMPAGRDLAEPAPGPNLYRDNQGRVRAAPAASDGDHQ